jgi:predicted nucleic acid-binding protein
MRRGQLSCPFRLDEEADAVKRLLARYDDLPVSLTDACLVRMAELYDDSSVLTLDRDFSVYRKHGRQVIS